MVVSKLVRFTNECVRVFKLTRKPSKEEFKMIVKMSGLGIAIIGILGFLLSYMKELLR